MAAQNLLIMNLLRLITPEEIGDIATKHNGGKFLSLTDLVNERVEHKIYRDFTDPDSIDEIHQEHARNQEAKILPFKKAQAEEVEKVAIEKNTETNEKEAHKENENMSSFILIEKARLKRSQNVLKQKEVIELYQRNSNLDVEQIKSTNTNSAQADDAGVLVNKKHY